MFEPSRRGLFKLAASLVPFAASVMAPESARPEFAPSAPRERIQKRYLPNVVLRTQDDKPVRFYDDLVKDKVGHDDQVDDAVKKIEGFLS